MQKYGYIQPSTFWVKFCLNGNYDSIKFNSFLLNQVFNVSWVSYFFFVESDVNDESVLHTLRLLHPKLEAQILLAKQVALIEPLKDLAAHEEDTR